MPQRKGITLRPENVFRVTVHGRVNASSFHRGTLYHGKIHLVDRPTSPLTRLRAQKAFLKPLRNDRESLEAAAHEVRLREKMRAARLPVSRAGIVSGELNKEMHYFLAVEPYLRKGGTESKLTPINNRFTEKPTLLGELDPEKDRAVIERTAELSARTINAGFCFRFFDFIGYYKGAKGLSPLIMDAESLFETTSQFEKHRTVRFALREARDAIPSGSMVYRIFEQAFLKALKPANRP